MAPPDKKKNLLEAFRHAGDSGSSEPFAPRPSGNDPPAPTAYVPSAAPAWLPWGIAVVVAFVLGLAVGRGSVGEAEAGGSEDADPAGTARERDGAGTGGTRGTNSGTGLIPRDGGRLSGRGTGPEDPAARTRTALDDPANQYTLVAATYGKSRLEYAWRNVDYLKSKGLPVFDPVDQKRYIVVLVGAGPDRASLADLERRVQALDGPDGERRPYADAYPYRIDKLLDRR